MEARYSQPVRGCQVPIYQSPFPFLTWLIEENCTSGLNSLRIAATDFEVVITLGSTKVKKNSRTENFTNCFDQNSSTEGKLLEVPWALGHLCLVYLLDIFKALHTVHPKPTWRSNFHPTLKAFEVFYQTQKPVLRFKQNELQTQKYSSTAMPDLHTFFRARSTQRLCHHVLIKALSGSHFVATDFDSTKASKRRPLAVNSQPSLSARANHLRSTG